MLYVLDQKALYICVILYVRCLAMYWHVQNVKNYLGVEITFRMSDDDAIKIEVTISIVGEI